MDTHSIRSKYGLFFSCCNDENCCPDRCPKVRKLLRPLLPNGFIPPPMKVQMNRDSGEFSIARAALSDHKVPFLSLPTRALYPGAANMPFDSFTPSMQSKLQNVVCDICFTSFPSKAQMLVHRRDLHKYERKGDFTMDALIKVISEYIVDFRWIFLRLKKIIG